LKSLSEDLKDFIRKCLVPDEKKRLGLRELTGHPFINRIMMEAPPPLLRKATSN
jgi:serine/threonine protein kinase